ncbi:heterogeneous nuclear ribonucleoprotein A0 isoform X5 [Strongylocentrotus purpuratus]|uniref:RRM domain-containing protein n=1 Tax=Strongylocentrotus purpuratus TaxID=7668 RepID=A0A7M7N961_STRPU|nr:heterogeneous nuclear ribonucleoprotein A0 isoform X5 [Strongylocentrotus purpuratus]
MNIVLNPPTNSKMDRMGEEVGKIFVGGVSRETTIDAFRAYFESFGQINDIVLMMDKDTRMNKGYGFVKFEDPRCSEDVLGKKGQHQLDGKMLDTKPCNARGSKPRGYGGGGGQDDSRTKKVFVGGISQQASKDDLYELFKQFGMVEDVHIMTDNETGKHRGFGFVTLDSEEDVEKLVRIQHLELKGKSMEIKKAQPKMNRGFGGPGGPMGGGGGYQQGGGGGFNQGGQQGYGGGYGGKPNAEGDNGSKSSRNGGQSYGSYGGYGQTQQDPYGQQQQQTQQTQQYGNQGSMGSYGQEASGYGPQRVNYSQQQQGGYSQGQFGNNMPGQNFGPPQQQQQHPQPQPPQQQQPQQGYGQQVEGGPDMYGNNNNNFGRGNLGGGNQFHPYRRFQGNQVQ